MDTFYFLLWTAAIAAFFFHRRLWNLVKIRFGERHWLSSVLAAIGLVMIFSWGRAAIDFLGTGRPGWPAWIAAAVYLATAYALLRALGPAADASPLFKRIPPPALPVAITHAEESARSEIEA